MTYDEYKKHLEACGPLDDISKGLLSAFELGYGQGIKDGKTHFTKALAEPEQEPVAWKDRLIKIHDALSNELGDTDSYIDEDMTDEEICYELPVFWAAKEIADLIGEAPWTNYTAPPKREWVGLTDEERKDIELGIEVFDMSVEDILKEAESKLWEKNT